MRSRASLGIVLVFVWSCMAQSPFKTAMPGYRYEFPRDYFNHPEFQTEWWYYTGNVTASDGHQFGFELTFFRQGISPHLANADTWDVRDIYLAHLALSDLDGKAFHHVERTNRAGPGIAGIDEKQGRIWNGNWSVGWSGEDQILQATDKSFSFRLTLHSQKPPVIHGDNGVSQKAEGTGHASHYISLTRLATTGTIQVNNTAYSVSGFSWMDHEFFTHQLEKNQVGWDWFSVQLNNNTELMLYRIRRADGSVDPFSSGTYVDASGRTTHLRQDDFSLVPKNETWKSPITGATYPVHWRVSVPRLELELEATTRLGSQELVGSSGAVPNYWEGAIELNGFEGKAGINGAGYLEMTGYDRAVSLGSTERMR
jgi:predicted secreted hydrolase